MMFLCNQNDSGDVRTTWVMIYLASNSSSTVAVMLSQSQTALHTTDRRTQIFVCIIGNIIRNVPDN